MQPYKREPKLRLVNNEWTDAADDAANNPNFKAKRTVRKPAPKVVTKTSPLDQAAPATKTIPQRLKKSQHDANRQAKADIEPQEGPQEPNLPKHPIRTRAEKRALLKADLHGLDIHAKTDEAAIAFELAAQEREAAEDKKVGADHPEVTNPDAWDRHLIFNPSIRSPFFSL